ncbi:hypothetical protein KPH14_006637 [Odynerus spinipes]|uniref:TATA box-binding protein-associated factor RNA polymerase I subunit B n=1 Tax=Odynerus spinipes TaxID=1348599 RepID=A0AAD9RQY1_9HYME|nr:hypothetical protein KPH14_006637 [Odynerus spinipes]
MEGDTTKKQSCRICGGTDFFKDAGFYYCETCQTQNEDVREEVLDMRVDTSTRLRRVTVKKSKVKRHGEDLGWTTWELYNFVLIGLTDELIELGASSNVKLTVLQLWAAYLGKIEVAFTSMTKKDVPKLSRKYNKKDAEIIYGKVQMQKKTSRRSRSVNSSNTSVVSGYQSDGTSSRMFHKSKKLMVKAEYDRYLQSQASSENDAVSTFSQSGYSTRSEIGGSLEKEEKIYFNKSAKQETRKIKELSKKLLALKRDKFEETYVTSQYRGGPQVITVMKLWAIVYLALRIHDEPIHLGDMLRYAREGYMSYYRLDHLLPPEVKLSQKDVNFLSQNTEITHKGMRRIAANMATFIGIQKINSTNILSLISRYCQELALPRGILLYAERLIALSPPTMMFDSKKSYIPNYEARAMAYIIVVLKVLFGLDGVTERAISKTAEHINTLNFHFHMCKNFVQNIAATKLIVMSIERCHYQNNKCCRKKNGVSESFENVTCNNSEKKLICETDTNSPCIIVHGGIGHCKDFAVVEKITACKTAAFNGYKKLMSGGSSIEAVEAALWWLECDEFFNCGYGSVLNEIGQVEMDASIMDGDKFECGSVAAVSDIEHPISLAKYVLENLPNTIIVGESTKQLARCANINWLSKGNMIAPTAYLAYKLNETGNYVADLNIEDLEHVRTLQNSTGTVGCVAWNGHSIAAGTTTGGLNRKMVGRVGDSPLLGYGTYADKNIGCSLTGHGESIIKLGIARRIAEDINQGYDPRAALQKNFDYMLTKFAKNGGGIVLTKDGSWDVYFTFKRMPYAFVKNDMVTFGIDLNEQKTESYTDINNSKFCDCESAFVITFSMIFIFFLLSHTTTLYIAQNLLIFCFSLASKLGVLDKELFSFCEWQRYIECRKNIVANMHFPTKLKYNPNVPLKSHMYFKFLEYIQSKRDGEPEITNYKHLLPRDLANAMKQCIENLNQDNISSEEVRVFAPSLTPFHSYLQQILDDSTDQLPDILRTDFYVTKVGYMTNIRAFKQLAMQCNIDLDITDSSSHFIDKVVPYFEPSKLPNLSELQEDVEVHERSAKDENVKAIDNFVTYMDKNIPCYIRINNKKLQYFDDVQSLLEMTTNSTLNDDDDFVFKDVSPNGKLLISEENDSESEDDVTHLKDVFANKTSFINEDACKKYNVTLTNMEQESMHKPQKLETVESYMKRNMHRFRDSKGKFIKAAQAKKLNNISSPIKSKAVDELNIDELGSFIGLNFDIGTDMNMDILQEAYNIFALEDQQRLFNEEDYNNDPIPNLDDCFDLSDISILCEDSSVHELDINGKTSPLSDIVDLSEQTSNRMRFYRPFKDYWMYHCIFSRVKGKNFELFEKVLPRSFRWLLNECANILEMTMEDLYEEVCIIESFHSQILNSDNIHKDTQCHSTEFSSRFHRSLIISKW